MITLSEWVWLRHRSGNPYCEHYCVLFDTMICRESRFGCALRPTESDIRDAAEFSERVAVRLANREDCMGDWCYYFPFDESVCPACLMKQAHLYIEEEMDDKMV